MFYRRYNNVLFGIGDAMSIEAMKMALEALKKYTCVVTSGTNPNKWDEVVDGGAPARKAIEELRQAIEQAEKPCKTGSQCIGGKCPECEREWVGLTEEEFAHYSHWIYPEKLSELENLLKEKNSV
jgi:hypothetical protein